MIGNNDEQQYHMQILEVTERHRSTIYFFISLSFLIKVELW